MGKQQSVSSEEIARRRGSRGDMHVVARHDTWEHVRGVHWELSVRATGCLQHSFCKYCYSARLVQEHWIVHEASLPGVQVGNKSSWASSI